MTARKEVKNMTSGQRITYRFTFNQLKNFLAEISQTPAKSVKEMKNWNHDRWVFARDAGFVKEEQGLVVLTKLGEDFLNADKSGREALFRAVILGIEQFASIWSKVEAKSIENEGKVSKEDIKIIVTEATGTESQKMAGIYRSRITNWAKNAGLLHRVPGQRKAAYKIRETHPFGPMVAVKMQPTEIAERKRQMEEPSRYASVSFLNQINLVVCDILTDPSDKSLQDELALLTAKWKHIGSDPEIGLTDKKLIINELTAALEMANQRGFQMVAETLKIVRREKLPQKKLAEFTT